MAAGKKGAQRKTGEKFVDLDHEARFLKAFDEYADALFRHAYYRLSDRERAIEVVHDTFTKAWSYLRAGHDIEAFKPFLYKVLGNLIIDEYRRRKEESLDALFEAEGVDEGTFAELHTGGAEEVAFALDAKQASAHISALPLIYREVITLRYIDGLGPKEIADLIEVTENIVSVRIYRGLKLLRERIEAEDRGRTHKHTRS